MSVSVEKPGRDQRRKSSGNRRAHKPLCEVSLLLPLASYLLASRAGEENRRDAFAKTGFQYSNGNFALRPFSSVPLSAWEREVNHETRGVPALLNSFEALP
jgi:hypothetical protein